MRSERPEPVRIWFGAFRKSAWLLVWPEWIAEWVMYSLRRSALLELLGITVLLAGVGNYLLSSQDRRDQQIFTAYQMLSGPGSKDDTGLRRKALRKLVELRADLSGVNLSGWSMDGIDLSGLQMENVNLQGSILADCPMEGANLRFANLKHAELLQANLMHADLGGADLRGARLFATNVRSANLTGTNLEGADVAKADFRGVEGLECYQLTKAYGWRSSYRDAGAACGGRLGDGYVESGGPRRRQR